MCTFLIPEQPGPEIRKNRENVLYVLPPSNKDSHKAFEHDAIEFSKFYFRFWTSTSSVQKVVLQKAVWQYV